VTTFLSHPRYLEEHPIRRFSRVRLSDFFRNIDEHRFQVFKKAVFQFRPALDLCAHGGGTAANVVCVFPLLEAAILVPHRGQANEQGQQRNSNKDFADSRFPLQHEPISGVRSVRMSES
jgi:hypothetical protein